MDRPRMACFGNTQFATDGLQAALTRQGVPVAAGSGDCACLLGLRNVRDGNVQGESRGTASVRCEQLHLHERQLRGPPEELSESRHLAGECFGCVEQC